MNAEHQAEMLDLHLMEAGVPIAFRCAALEAVENWLRGMKERGSIIETFGIKIVIAAIKHLRAKHCAEPKEQA